jgi:hypothetical protein
MTNGRHQVHVRFLMPGAPRGLLSPGSRFWLMKRTRVVAEGRVSTASGEESAPIDRAKRHWKSSASITWASASRVRLFCTRSCSRVCIRNRYGVQAQCTQDRGHGAISDSCDVVRFVGARPRLPQVTDLFPGMELA